MSQCKLGVLLTLTLLAIFACAAADSFFPAHKGLFFIAAMILMVPMCYLCEMLDGGSPAFYDDIHRTDGHA
ncbi:MAG: hypothetical protein WC714_19810 [Candidatus Obscuribacterales bacterium]|jgi:hypothetical protein